MNLQSIKTKVEELRYRGGIKALAEAVGMTEQNLHRCVRENKIQAQVLEKIASELNVSVLCFFDEAVAEPRLEETGIKGKINNLNQKIRQSQIIAGDHNQLNESGTHDNINGDSSSILHERIKFLEEKLKDKEERLREKDERIQERKERIKELKDK